MCLSSLVPFFVHAEVTPITIHYYIIRISLPGHTLEVILVKTVVLFRWFLSDIRPKYLVQNKSIALSTLTCTHAYMEYHKLLLV